MFGTTTKNLAPGLLPRRESADDHFGNPIFGPQKKVAPPVHESLGPGLFTKAQLMSEFRRFDSNKDGRLSRQELKNAFNSLGSKLPIYRAFMGLYQADENRDGYITEEEMDKLVRYALSCGYHVH